MGEPQDESRSPRRAKDEGKPRNESKTPRNQSETREMNATETRETNQTAQDKKQTAISEGAAVFSRVIAPFP